MPPKHVYNPHLLFKQTSKKILSIIWMCVLFSYLKLNSGENTTTKEKTFTVILSTLQSDTISCVYFVVLIAWRSAFENELSFGGPRDKLAILLQCITTIEKILCQGKAKFTIRIKSVRVMASFNQNILICDMLPRKFSL